MGTITCFQLIMCGCVQQRSKRMRRIGERVGTVIFVVVAIVTLIMSKGDMFYMWETGQFSHAVMYFVGAKLASWFGATCFNICAFCVLFRLQRPKSNARCLRDPPIEYGAADTRGLLAKIVSPRFCILVTEHQRFVEWAERASATPD